MKIPVIAWVRHDSDYTVIIKAILYAGAYISAANPHRRRHDIPAKEARKHRTYSGFAWVTPNDIGYSSDGDPRLLNRLKLLVKSGYLEMRYYGRMPRFRVARKHIPR